MSDRIALNPMLEIQETAGEHGANSGGSLDSHNETPMEATILDVTKATKINAPTNPPSTWSADNPY